MLFKDILENLNMRELDETFIEGFLKPLEKNRRVKNIKVDEKGRKKIISFLFKAADKKEYEIEIVVSNGEKVFVEIKNYEGDLSQNAYFENPKNKLFEIGLNGFTFKLRDKNVSKQKNDRFFSIGFVNSQLLINILMNILK